MNKNSLLINLYDEDFRRKPQLNVEIVWDFKVKVAPGLNPSLAAFSFDDATRINTHKIEKQWLYVKFDTHPKTIKHNHDASYLIECYYDDSIEEISLAVNNPFDNIEVLSLPNSLKRIPNTLSVSKKCNLLNTQVLSNIDLTIDTPPIAENAMWDGEFIPKGNVIPNRWFYGCIVPNLRLYDNVTIYGESCYESSTLTGDIVIKSNVTLGKRSFCSTNINNIRFKSTPNELLIPDSLCENCQTLEHIDIEVEETQSCTIKNKTFYNCPKLKSFVFIGEKLKSVVTTTLNCIGMTDAPVLIIIPYCTDTCKYGISVKTNIGFVSLSGSYIRCAFYFMSTVVDKSEFNGGNIDPFTSVKANEILINTTGIRTNTSKVATFVANTITCTEVLETAYARFQCKELICYAKTPPSGDITTSLCESIKVPLESIDLYKADVNFGKYANIITAIE